MGEVIHEWGQRVYGKFLYVQLDFVVNLKLHLKSLFKKVVAVIKRKQHLLLVSLGHGSNLGVSTSQLCNFGLVGIQYPDTQNWRRKSIYSIFSKVTSSTVWKFCRPNDQMRKVNDELVPP